jgi:hypothetical protein
MFDLPEGDSTVLINVKSKTQRFFPNLFFYKYDSKSINDLIMPPSELISELHRVDEWDEDLFVMKFSLDFNGL